MKKYRDTRDFRAIVNDRVKDRVNHHVDDDLNDKISPSSKGGGEFNGDRSAWPWHAYRLMSVSQSCVLIFRLILVIHGFQAGFNSSSGPSL